MACFHCIQIHGDHPAFVNWTGKTMGLMGSNSTVVADSEWFLGNIQKGMKHFHAPLFLFPLHYRRCLLVSLTVWHKRVGGGVEWHTSLALVR